MYLILRRMKISRVTVNLTYQVFLDLTHTFTRDVAIRR